MLKQLLINQAVAYYDLLNLPQQTIRVIYNTNTKNLKIIDTYNGIETDLTLNGQIAVNQTIINQLEQIKQKIRPISKGALVFKGKKETKEELESITDAQPGDVYLVGSQEEYVYVKDENSVGQWVLLGQEASLKANKEDLLHLNEIVQTIKETVVGIEEFLLNVKDNTNDIQYMISKVNSIA